MNPIRLHMHGFYFGMSRASVTGADTPLASAMPHVFTQRVETGGT